MEEIYIEQPPGYEKKGQEHKVCRLKKALYGLKQAPRAWYNRIDSYLQESGFEKCNDDYLIGNFKAVMKEEFEMTDMGLDSKAAITPTVMGLKLSKKDSNKDFDPSLYKSIIGRLMYLTATRPDIIHVVILLSRFMERPKEAHWQATKRILSYVKGTKRFGILYTTSECSNLIGYTDSDWAGSVVDRKSTSGYVFHIGSGAISWASKKQPIVVLSTTKAEYVVATATTC
eukprot:PITA_20128